MGTNNSKEEDQKKKQQQDQLKKQEQEKQQLQLKQQEEKNKGKNTNDKNQQKVDSTPVLWPMQPPDQPIKPISQIVVHQNQNVKAEFTKPQSKQIDQSVIGQNPLYISAIQEKQEIAASIQKGSSQIYNSQNTNRGKEPNVLQSQIREKQDSTNQQQGTFNQILESQVRQNNSIINNPQVKQSQINHQVQTNQSQIGKQSVIAQSQRSVILQSVYRPKTELENINETSQIVEQIQKSGIYGSEKPNQMVKIQKIIYDLIDLFIYQIIQIEAYNKIFVKEQEIYIEQMQKILLFIKYNQILAEQLDLQKPEYKQVIEMAQQLLNDFVQKVDFMTLSKESQDYIYNLVDAYQGKKQTLNFEYQGEQSTIQLAYDEELDLGTKIDSIINQQYERATFKYSYQELMDGKLKYLQFCRKKIRSKSDQYKFQQFQFALEQCDFQLRIVFSRIYRLYQQNQSDEIMSQISTLEQKQQIQLMDLIFQLEQTNITALYDFIQIVQCSLDLNYKNFRQEQLDVFMNILEQ
ncbi:hypothetical protein pb186bvf_011955 [Paramecium bursaria]